MFNFQETYDFNSPESQTIFGRRSLGTFVTRDSWDLTGEFEFERLESHKSCARDSGPRNHEIMSGSRNIRILGLWSVVMELLMCRPERDRPYWGKKCRINKFKHSSLRNYGYRKIRNNSVIMIFALMQVMAKSRLFINMDR